uniref:Thiamine diphosphokinase n=1 Tax=Panagrellus redivivus TaxID=6233 RepID=A0A7E4UQJ0_PANRE
MPVLDLQSTLYGPRILALLTNAPANALPSVWQILWRSAPIRVATDGAANNLVAPCTIELAKTAPDRVLPLPSLISGDFDSISTSTRKFFEASGVELVLTEDQDETDLTKLFRIVSTRFSSDFDGIVVLGGLGGRFDHTLATINSLINMAEVVRKPIWVLDAYNAVTVLPANASTQVHLPPSIKKLLPGACGVMPIVQRPTKVTMTGFRWNLENAEIAFGGLISSSNQLAVSEDNPYLEIRPSEPVILSMEVDWSHY